MGASSDPVLSGFLGDLGPSVDHHRVDGEGGAVAHEGLVTRAYEHVMERLVQDHSGGEILAVRFAADDRPGAFGPPGQTLPVV